MKQTMLFAFVVAVTAVIALAQQGGKPGFKHLSEAVSFITECVDKSTTNVFSEAFIGGAGTESHKHVFAELQRINRKTPLSALYEGKDFPTNQPAFTLGGHFKELGCIHITFVRTNEVWRLADTAICR